MYMYIFIFMKPTAATNNVPFDRDATGDFTYSRAFSSQLANRSVIHFVEHLNHSRKPECVFSPIIRSIIHPSIHFT